MPKFYKKENCVIWANWFKCFAVMFVKMIKFLECFKIGIQMKNEYPISIWKKQGRSKDVWSTLC